MERLKWVENESKTKWILITNGVEMDKLLTRSEKTPNEKSYLSCVLSRSLSLTHTHTHTRLVFAVIYCRTLKHVTQTPDGNGCTATIIQTQSLQSSIVLISSSSAITPPHPHTLISYFMQIVQKHPLIGQVPGEMAYIPCDTYECK